ncbi:MAG TPA: ImmA/IrrE family metallo-endopeptidase [Nitrospiraceae bacterium]|nr:ImmA/IrrE family metallo-endopeptidase [Nitrospiraceae bacterium]
MNRVVVKPELLRWARERAGRRAENLSGKFPKLPAWEAGEVRPTLKQLEQFARTVHVPVGYLFLREPPVERVPIPDFRTIADTLTGRPSPDLLDTIYLCQRRQAWYRDWARSMGEEPRAFVGSARLTMPIEETAATMRRALGFDLDARRECSTWTEALRQFIAQADDLGVLVMVSGVVGSNNHRRLDPEEFRGFALADDLAPLVFINGADTKAAQMFTLAHELAHVWLGESALTDVTPGSTPTQRIESWCNRVAAELLVPLAVLREELPRGDVLIEVPRLARHFKVSTLVILRRLLDARRLTREAFETAYDEELARLREMPKTSGGDFYLTQAARLSRRFARALVASTLEGQTLYRDAFRMLGIARETTFRELGASLGYPI